MPPSSVSVVVPTHDRSQLVCRALRSVARQTRPADEVIVVDDGSRDDTVARIRREFPGVRLLRQPNRGVSTARNAGIRAAGARWVAFLDSDDEWRPAKLERQLEALEASPHAICHCDEIWIRDGQRVNPRRRHAKRGGRIYRHCLPLCAISPSAAVVERHVFDAVGLFDERLPVCEDYDLWLRIAARFPVLYVDERLVLKYGGHDDQLSRSRWGLDRFRVRALAAAWRRLDLAGDERRATLETLVEKLEILLNGARKRDRRRFARRLEARLAHFRRLLWLERLAGSSHRLPGAPAHVPESAAPIP